jgi:hypothetical protein
MTWYIRNSQTSDSNTVEHLIYQLSGDPKDEHIKQGHAALSDAQRAVVRAFLEFARPSPRSEQRHLPRGVCNAWNRLLVRGCRLTRRWSWPARAISERGRLLAASVDTRRNTVSGRQLNADPLGRMKMDRSVPNPLWMSYLAATIAGLMVSFGPSSSFSRRSLL